MNASPKRRGVGGRGGVRMTGKVGSPLTGGGKCDQGKEVQSKSCGDEEGTDLVMFKIVEAFEDYVLTPYAPGCFIVHSHPHEEPDSFSDDDSDPFDFSYFENVRDERLYRIEDALSPEFPTLLYTCDDLENEIVYEVNISLAQILPVSDKTDPMPLLPRCTGGTLLTPVSSDGDLVNDGESLRESDLLQAINDALWNVHHHTSPAGSGSSPYSPLSTIGGSLSVASPAITKGSNSSSGSSSTPSDSLYRKSPTLSKKRSTASWSSASSASILSSSISSATSSSLASFVSAASSTSTLLASGMGQVTGTAVVTSPVSETVQPVIHAPGKCYMCRLFGCTDTKACDPGSASSASAGTLGSSSSMPTGTTTTSVTVSQLPSDLAKVTITHHVSLAELPLGPCCEYCLYALRCGCPGPTTAAASSVVGLYHGGCGGPTRPVSDEVAGALFKAKADELRRARRRFLKEGWVGGSGGDGDDVGILEVPVATVGVTGRARGIMSEGKVCVVGGCGWREADGSACAMCGRSSFRDVGSIKDSYVSVGVGVADGVGNTTAGRSVGDGVNSLSLKPSRAKMTRARASSIVTFEEDFSAAVKVSLPPRAKPFSGEEWIVGGGSSSRERERERDRSSSSSRKNGPWKSGGGTPVSFAVQVDRLDDVDEVDENDDIEIDGGEDDIIGNGGHWAFAGRVRSLALADADDGGDGGRYVRFGGLAGFDGDCDDGED
ncbi:hypothetical protein HDU76_013809 [Blyttiomyces sp. JEL0837]|nr:hypothetical protein HDU76_013809 [Blyttiomyces sp. JEL0837]